MKRKIILHGYLKDLYPEVLEVEAESVAEAVKALENIPALVREDGTPHLVSIRGIDSDIALYSNSDMDEIHISPRVGGSGGRGGFMQILIGVVLIAVALVFPAIAFLGFTSTSLLVAGGLMLLGGVLQMLLPVPDTNDNTDTNRYLGASINTVQIGTRIPLIYGTRRWGGHYLSFDVDAKEVAPGTGGGATPPVAPDYYVHDDTTLSRPLAPINPVYATPVTSPSQMPISSWSSLV